MRNVSHLGCIDTLDSWCCSYYRRMIGGSLPYDRANRSVDFDQLRAAVLDDVAVSDGDPPFRFVLVDEGQDLSEEAFELINLLGRHVTVCIDHKQQIYENGSSETDILDSLGLARHNLSLLGTYRCTP